MHELNEDEILDLAVQGDSDAFSMLYELHVEKIYNYIYYRTGNTFDAQDLTARVFYRALDHIRSYKKKGVPFSAWLYRIAHNLVANWYRDRNRQKEVPLEDYTTTPLQRLDLPETSLVKNQENEWLLKTIRKLPTDRQQLLILKFVEGLSNADIATIMGRSEGAIKGLYHRTLISLRNQTKKDEREELQ